jgi:hypothetical protein
MPTKPLSPIEVFETVNASIPDCVIEAVNDLLTKHYQKGYASISQAEIIAKIKKLNPHITNEELFNNGWINFEPLFENVGWKIIYDSPGIEETYDVFYKFSK